MTDTTAPATETIAAPAVETTAPAAEPVVNDTTADAVPATTETQTTTEQTAADPAKVEAPKAPEKYELAPPEGSQFSPDVLGKFENVARKLDLSQAEASELVNEVAPAIQQAMKAEQSRIQGEWQEAAKTDKEFGGDKLSENLAIAGKALDAFGTPELRALLDATGLGNNPEIIRAFYRAGKQISSSAFVTGGLSQSSESVASKLYPNMN